MSTTPVAAPDERSLRPHIAWRRLDWLVCGGLVVVALLLRWPQWREPLWVDELHTGWVVAEGLSELPARAAQGNQSPLWFLLPWLTTRLELAPWTLRLPSLAAGLAALPLTYALARRLAGRTAAGYAALLQAAFDPQWAFYFVEARGYSCVQLLALLHWSAWQALDAPRVEPLAPPSSWKRRAAWIATGVGLFYVHYTAALVLVAELVADLVQLSWQRHTRQARTRAVDYALVALGCLPALGALRGIAAHRDDWSQALTASSPWKVFPWYTSLLVPAAVFVVATWLARGRATTWRWSPSPQLLVRLSVWLLVPVALATLATWTDAAQLLRFRYLVGAAALLPLAVAILVSAASKPLARSCLLLAVTMLPIWHHEPLRAWLRSGEWPAERRENWAAVVALLDRDPPTDSRPILLCPALVEDRHLAVGATPPPPEQLVEFCRFPLRSIYRLRESTRAGARELWPLSTLESPRLTAEQRAAIREAGGCQLVVRGEDELADWIAKSLAAELRPSRVRAVHRNRDGLGALRVIDFTVAR
ncbi:MAG: hypothetical protein U0939_16100 [Pirellulales bacterium]